MRGENECGGLVVERKKGRCDWEREECEEEHGNTNLNIDKNDHASFRRPKSRRSDERDRNLKNADGYRQLR